MSFCTCRKAIWFSFFFLLASSSLSAQDFNVTVYDELRGFNRNYVNDIVRDSNGFLWLATDRGIVRFDGVNFLEAPAPAGNQGDVLRLRLFGDKLYLIYRGTGAGLLNLKSNRYTTISTKPVGDLLQLSDGSFIIFYADGLLVLQKNGVNISEVMTGADPAGTLHYRWGKVFVKTQSAGLMVADPANFSAIQKLPVHCCTWRVIFQDVGKRVLVSSNEGFFELDSTLSARILKPIPKSLESDHTSWIQKNSTNALFISKDSEVIQKQGDGFKRYPFQDKRVTGLRTLFLYDSVNLLIGANGALLHLSFYPSSLTSLNQDKAAVFPEFRVRRKIITLGPDNFLLLGNPGFIQWKQGQFKNLLDSGLFSTYDGIVYGDDVYATTENSFERYSLSKRKLQTIQAAGITSSDNFYTVSLDTLDNTFVLGGKETMFRYYPEEKRAIRTKSIGTSSARVVKRAPGKPLWFVGTTDGLYVLDDELKQVKRMRKQDGVLRGNTISDLLFIDSAGIWVTHEHGAEKINIVNYSVTDSVPASAFNDSRVTAVLQDGRNHLWFSTFNGILGFDPISRGTVKLGRRNNLINKEFNYKAASVLPDGRLMFGGLDGYDLIDPEAFSFNNSRPDGVVAGYRRTGENGVSEDFVDLNPEHISFDTEHESLRIYLTTRRLPSSATNRYEFRLNEGTWNSLEGLAHLDIYKLRQGNYKLEFRGFDQYGTLITFPSVQLRADIIFYKSILFIWSATGLIVTLSVIIFLIILKNRSKEQRIKESISMDLHDELGTILTKAVLAYRSEPKTNHYTKVEDYLKEGLHSLRVFIDTMNQSEFSLETLVIEIRESILPALAIAGVKSEIHYDHNLEVKLQAVLFRDIKLCIYESVNNALKYASARTLHISISGTGEFLEVLISDDGILSDVHSIEEKGGGIGNLRKRTDKYQGTVEFSIGPQGHGLQIRFRFPL